MRRRHGYTLVELLVVAVLAVSLLGISVAGYRTWIRATASDASTTLLLAELERARAHALARCCATRVSLFDDEKGDLVLIERLDPANGEDWYPLSRTNRLDWTHVEPSRLFFRPDGSCCTNENLLAGEADFAEYGMVLKPRARKTATAAPNQPEPRLISVNARTGFAKAAVNTQRKTEAKP